METDSDANNADNELAQIENVSADNDITAVGKSTPILEKITDSDSKLDFLPDFVIDVNPRYPKRKVSTTNYTDDISDQENDGSTKRRKRSTAGLKTLSVSRIASQHTTAAKQPVQGLKSSIKPKEHDIDKQDDITRNDKTLSSTDNRPALQDMTKSSNETENSK